MLGGISFILLLYSFSIRRRKRREEIPREFLSHLVSLLFHIAALVAMVREGGGGCEMVSSGLAQLSEPPPTPPLQK